MELEVSLDSLLAQLATSPIAFGTDNPVNPALRADLEGALHAADVENLDPAGVVVLEQTPARVADLRDLAQDLANSTDYGTVIVRTPQVAIGVSDHLNRAQIERGERAMVAEPDYADGLHAFARAADGVTVHWPLAVAVALLVLAGIAVAAAMTARR